MRTDHIRALEEGDFNVFSAPIYIRGSVKNYATLLKLDVPQIMAVLDAELGRTEKFSEPPPLTKRRRPPLDRLMFAALEIQLAGRTWPAARSWRVVIGRCARQCGPAASSAQRSVGRSAARRLSAHEFRRHAAAGVASVDFAGVGSRGPFVNGLSTCNPQYHMSVK